MKILSVYQWTIDVFHYRLESFRLYFFPEIPQFRRSIRHPHFEVAPADTNYSIISICADEAVINTNFVDFSIKLVGASLRGCLAPHLGSPRVPHGRGSST